jgi:hypothetical protein
MMRWPPQCAIVIVASMLNFTSVHADEMTSAHQDGELSVAVAKVRLQRAMTTALLRKCGDRFSQLKSETEQASTQWLDANRTVLDKADHLQQRLLQSLQQEQSAYTAETFALDIDLVVQQSVKHLEQRLAAYPPPQQHTVCNHLILSVKAGDWDVQHKQAEAYSILENYR